LVIVWKDDLTIEQVQTAHKELLDAFKSEKEVILDLSELSDLDLSAMQLILAAQKESEKTGVAFSIQGPIPDFINTVVNYLGITPQFSVIKVSSKKDEVQENQNNKEDSNA